MPKLVANPKTTTQIQADSDARRGVKVKGIKMSLDDISLLEQLAKDEDRAQAHIVADALRLYANSRS